MPGRTVLVTGSIAGAFVAGLVGIAVFHQGSGWLLHLAGVYPSQYKTQPIPPIRSASNRSLNASGEALGNPARLDIGALAERELLAACVRIWPGRPDARRLVRGAGHKGHADHGRPTLDNPGSTSAAKPRMGYRHSMATHISSRRIHLASLMLPTPQPRLGSRVVTQAAPCQTTAGRRPAAARVAMSVSTLLSPSGSPRAMTGLPPSPSPPLSLPPPLPTPSPPPLPPFPSSFPFPLSGVSRAVPTAWAKWLLWVSKAVAGCRGLERAIQLSGASW